MTMTDTAFPDHEYLTVKELAELLRLKERKVYDLAASGEVPCARATGKLLFPADGIRDWIARSQTGGGAAPEQSAPRPAIALGSHDPLLDWAIRQSRCGLATYYDGSLDGLDRFARGEGVMAGLHVRDASSDRWNVDAAERVASGLDAVLIAFAARRRGLVFRPGDRAPEGLPDLAGRRVVPRQPESGTETLFRELAAAEELDLGALILADEARTEDEAVEAVRRGEADIAFGLEAVARSFGLEFRPLVEERFDLLVDRRGYFEPPMQALLAFCATERFAARAAASGGYDTGMLGRVVWNA
ncbi:helix-turn-helix transcriptional regulator [Palleronia sediminis]